MSDEFVKCYDCQGSPVESDPVHVCRKHAAVDDLLTALRDLVGDVEAIEDLVWRGGGPSDLQHLLDAPRAAIARATKEAE